VSDMTMERFALPRPGRTTDSTNHGVDPGQRPSLELEWDDLLTWEPAAQTQVGGATVVVHVGVPAVGSSAEAFQRLAVQLGEDGTVIVSDPEGGAYGVGQSFSEAMEHWRHAAREHYDELRLHAERLHPRMQRQLAFLGLVFG